MKNKPATVLIIEDDDDIRDSLSEFLEMEGYAVVSAEHGLSALALIESKIFRPAFILLDLSMPEMDGKGFLAALEKYFPDFNKIPFLVITALPQSEIPKHIDPKRVMKKPLDADRLSEIIGRETGKLAA